MSKRNYLKYLLLILIVSPICLIAQTTSSISGFVKAKNGQVLNGSTITATHLPTGSVYLIKSTKAGAFELPNLTPGGPYDVVVTFTGFESNKISDIFLTLGENQKLDFVLQDKTVTLSDVVVSGKRPASKTGTETNISAEKINNMVSVGRNLNDYVRLNPQTKITGTGGISIGGQNNRYNAFMIDGAVNNDVFGLSASGTNGGQAGTPPISIDAIDQITVQVSPYDAAVGNFTGGGINAVTRRGTNNVEGSIYYFMRNQNTTGKTPGKIWQLANQTRTKLTNFDNTTFGFRVGGPIIKNKAFFFINAERQDDERPQPTTAPDILSNGVNILDSVTKLKTFLKSEYGYDPGDYKQNPDRVVRTNVNSRVDINAGTNSKLTFSYGYTKAERYNPNRSSATTINFENGAQFFPTVTHRASAEWNLKINNNTNNKLRISATDVNDDRGVAGNPFPAIAIRGVNGGPSYNVGSEAASTANLLKQRIINIFEQFRITAGKHNLSIGADIDLNKTYNLFINRNFGEYTYTNLQNFLDKKSPLRYRRGYSLVDANKGGDANVNSAATFNSIKLGFFANDDIKVSKNFTITTGLRMDQVRFLTKSPVDTFFRDVAIPVIKAAGYDLLGAEVGKMSSPRWQISPRLGFRYNLVEENALIKGGIGIFAGRMPLVWPGGIYQNNGVTIGGVDSTNNGGLNTVSGPLLFRPDIDNQYTQADFGLPANRNKPQGDVNLLAKKFNLPAVLKYSLGGEKKFNRGWTFGFDLLFQKNLVEIDWTNLNFNRSKTNLVNGPDKRSVYINPTNGFATGGNAVSLIYRPTASFAAERNPYSNVILLSNTTGKKGFAYDLSFKVAKTNKKGTDFGFDYTYGNSQVRNEGTSSVNVSNWQFMETVGGRNFNQLSTSDFDKGHRIIGFLSQKISYAKNHAATIFSFFYNGQSGNPYSYTYLGRMVGDGVFDNDLIYIPKDRAEMDQMVFLTQSNAAYPPTSNAAANIAAQKDAYEAFINSDRYLRKNRGKYTERNGARTPFTHQVDFKLQQEFSLKLGAKTHKFIASWDVFNFTNLLNANWGRQYFLTNDVFGLVSFAGYTTGNTPQYRFSPVANNTPYILSDGVTPFNNSRWTSQIGLRYQFN